MATTVNVQTVSRVAAADLRTHQFKFVVLNGSGLSALAGAGVAVDGVLANKPNTGETAEVQSDGEVNVIAGGAINPNGNVSSDGAGLAVAAAGGDVIAGRFIGKAACAANDVIRVKIDRYKI